MSTQRAPGLVLSARIETRNERHAHIGVFQNGAKAGVLIVDAEYAEQVAGLLNAGTDLLAVCEHLADVNPDYADSFIDSLQEEASAAIAKTKGQTQ